MFSTLLYVSSLRGMHSTGVFTAEPLSKKDFMKMKKLTCPSPEFIRIDSQDKTPILEEPFADVFLGHCRYATVGKLSRENAHPFDVGNLVGAHNGTLNDFWSWGKKDGPDGDKTDSQMMFERMNEKGIEAVLREMIPSSAYAISVYDKRTRKVTLARNKDRGLFVAFAKERGVLFWASEYAMLDFAGTRHGIELDIVYLAPRMIYEIDVNEVKKGERSPWDAKKLPEQTYGFTQWPKAKKSPATVIHKPVGNGTNGATPTELPWWEGTEDCCMCSKLLSIQDQTMLQPVSVDGVNYWVCTECANESEKQLKASIESEREKKANNQNLIQPESKSSDLLNIVTTH
jgi:hypothetical protein